METDVINNSFPNRATHLTFDNVSEGGVPTQFDVYLKHKDNPKEEEFFETVTFHKGNVDQYLNGLLEEDLILMVLTRLNFLQQTDSACMENAESILYLEKVLEAMSKRKDNIEQKNNGMYTV